MEAICDRYGYQFQQQRKEDVRRLSKYLENSRNDLKLQNRLSTYFCKESKLKEDQISRHFQKDFTLMKCKGGLPQTTQECRW